MSLPKPYYETELGKLYHGDCLEIMPQLEPVDLVVTSPPYDDLRKYEGYEFDFEATATTLKSTIKRGGVIVWVVGDSTVKGSETGTSFEQALYFKKIGLNIHDTMIYQKSQACFGSNNCYLQSFEYMFVFSLGRPSVMNFIRDRKNSRNGIEKMAACGLKADGSKAKRVYKEMGEYGKRKNIWEYGVGGGKTGHPAVFPERLAADHIISWSNEGDLVSDIMCGSGTTLCMAERLRRGWIGIEIEEKYCEIAAKRIELERKQLKLF